MHLRRWLRNWWVELAIPVVIVLLLAGLCVMLYFGSKAGCEHACGLHRADTDFDVWAGCYCVDDDGRVFNPRQGEPDGTDQEVEEP